MTSLVTERETVVKEVAGFPPLPTTVIGATNLATGRLSVILRKNGVAKAMARIISVMLTQERNQRTVRLVGSSILSLGVMGSADTGAGCLVARPSRT